MNEPGALRIVVGAFGVLILLVLIIVVVTIFSDKE